MSRRAWFALGVLAIAALVIAFVWDRSTVESSVERSARGRAGGGRDEPWSEDEWMRDDVDDDESPSRSARRDHQSRERRSAVSRSQRAPRRSGLRVEIRPLGVEPPSFAREAVWPALLANEDEMRACIHGAGGFGAMRRALVDTIVQAGLPRRMARFDVLPDGSVDALSIAFDPPVPDPFDACMRTFVASARFTDPGGGAHIEMRFGPRHYRGEGDGGVP